MSSRRSSPSLWMVLLLVAAVLVPTTLAASRGDRTFSTRNAYNDRRAPKPVGSLNVEAADSASITLDWSRTWDNVGVAGYGVYLDGARKSQTASTIYTFKDLVCGKGYDLGVDAFDDAGNRSRTTSTFASTAACGDVTAPSAPTNVRTVASTETQVILAWSPSTDDLGVVAYRLYVGGFWVGQWSEPSATITNLSCGQTYQIGIDASDAAGNESAPTTAFFSTAACSDHTPPSTPTGLAVSKSSTTGVTLNWTASTDISGIGEYGLYRDGSKVGTATGSTGDFTGLACGKSYTLGVDAADKAQNRSRVATLTAATAPCAPTTPPPPTDTGTPTAPPNVHTTAVTQTEVAVAWDSSTATNGMAGYQIFRDGGKIGEGPGVHGGWTNTWNDTGRTCGTTYRYGIAGVDTNGKVGPQSSIDVKTAACETAPTPPPTTTPPPPPPTTTPPPPSDLTAPTAPPNLHTTSVAQTTVALAWDSSTATNGVAGYQIFRDGGKIGEGPGVHGGWTNTWNDTGRTCGTTYRYGIAGVDTNGKVGPQSSLDVKTAACDTAPTTTSVDTKPPSVPANVAASTRTATSIALTWQPSTDNIGVAGYGLYLAGSRVGTSTTAAWIFGGLACGTTYTLAVDAVDASGNRSQQAVVMLSTTACTDTQAPTVPTGLKASNVTGTSATLSWSASTDNVGVTGYDVLSNGSKVASATTPSSTLSGLSCGVSYTFAIVAYDAAGNRSPQAQLVTSTAACPAAPPPPPASTGVVELSGAVSGSTVAQKIAAAPAGAVTVRPVSGGTATITGDVDISRSSVTLDHLTVNGVVTFTSGASGSKFTNGASNGFDVRGADNVTVEGNAFDGKCQRAQNWVIEEPAGQIPNGTTIRNNTFRNYYMCSDSSAHTEALFIAYSDGGVIEGNTFEDNGTTAHVFFSYVGANGSLDTSDYARNWCVRGNTFRRAINKWYSINFRQEIPASANTSVDPTSNTSDRILIGPTTTEAAEHTKSC